MLRYHKLGDFTACENTDNANSGGSVYNTYYDVLKTDSADSVTLKVANNIYRTNSSYVIKKVKDIITTDSENSYFYTPGTDGLSYNTYTNIIKMTPSSASLPPFKNIFTFKLFNATIPSSAITILHSGLSGSNTGYFGFSVSSVNINNTNKHGLTFYIGKTGNYPGVYKTVSIETPNNILNGADFTIEIGTIGEGVDGYVMAYWKLNDYYICYGTLPSQALGFTVYLDRIIRLKSVEMYDVYDEVIAPAVKITKEKTAGGRYTLTANATNNLEI